MRIAVDGPSASGKSTVAKMVADRLGYTYLDTGAMYRKVCAMALELGISVSDADALVDMLHRCWRTAEIDDDRLRSADVTAAVSEVSAHSEVREFLIDIQRKIASSNHIVMDGRDIGTVVLPDAEVKVYLDATPEVRAERRVLQSGRDYEYELQAIKRRDFLDSTRKTDPLRRAEDAVLIDTTALEIEDAVNIILDFAAVVSKRQ